MKIISTNIAKPTTIIWNGNEVITGIYKKPINQPIYLGKEGVKNDEVSDKKVHGGEFKACYLFSEDHYDYWKNLYPNLDWNWGMFGENLTVSRLNEKNIHIGDIYKIGSALVQVTQPREPCFKFGVKFGSQNALAQFVNHGFPGTYIRILEEGHVATGDNFILVEKAKASITTWQFFDLLFNQKIIIEKAKDYFNLISDKTITWKNNLNDRKTYYNNVKLRKEFPETFMNLIHNTLLNKNGKANLNDVVQNVNSELYLITKIYQKLKSDKDKTIVLTERQVKHISNWCFENINKVSFYKYTKKEDNNKKKCELLWFFRNYLDLTFSENQLLEMLYIDGSMYMNNDDIGYNYIIENVEKKALDRRIIDNLKNKNLTPIIFKNHAIYALKNELQEVNDLIKKFISTVKEYSWYHRKEILYVYFEKTNDTAFLKTLFKPHKTKEHSDDLSWTAIQLLLDSKEYDFVANTLNKFYKDNTIKSRELTILKYLIISNHDDAFKILYNSEFSVPGLKITRSGFKDTI